MNELEHYLPKFDFNEKHHLWICANPSKTYQAMKNLSWHDSRSIRFFLWLRGIRKKDWIEKSFTVLHEKPGEEIVWGLIAQPWKLSGNILRVSKENFEDFNHPDYVKAVWNFSFREQNQGTLVETETRILCLSEKSRIKFKWYWFLIKPFSGLIRERMLALIKRKSQEGP